jgi:hypothetical protein
MNQSRPAFEAVIDGFCQAAAVGNRRLQFGQPVVPCRQFLCTVLSKSASGFYPETAQIFQR